MSNNINLQIQLKKSTLSPSSVGWLNHHAYPIKVEAYSNINLENVDVQPLPNGMYPCNIFTLQLNGTGLDPNQGDRFVKVATAIDIDELPSYLIDTELSNLEDVKGYPFYRYHTIELFMNTVEEVEQFWIWLTEDVQQLVIDYNSVKEVVDSDTVIISGSGEISAGIYDSDELIIKGVDAEGNDAGLYSIGIAVNEDGVEPFINNINDESGSEHTYENEELVIKSKGETTEPYKVGVFVEEASTTEGE